MFAKKRIVKMYAIATNDMLCNYFAAYKLAVSRLVPGIE